MPRTLASLLPGLLLGAVLATGGTGAAQAATVTFDTLSTNVVVPTPHEGFQWGTGWVATRTSNRPTVYTSAASTSLFVRRFDGAAFYFDGADFWSRRGLDAAGDFWFVLYHKGQTVYTGVGSSKQRMRFTATPTLFKPPYTGPVDMVALAFGSSGKDWNHLAMDNFRYRLLP